MRRAVLLPIVLLFATLVVRAEPVPVAEIPFRFSDGFICLTARVTKSERPLNLILDSGAGASLLSVQAAHRLNAKFGASQDVRSVGSQSTAYEIRPIEMTTNSVALPPIGLAVDLSLAGQLCREPVDGLIGVDFFKDRVVQIDYQQKCLRLFTAAERPLVPDSAQRLPLRWQNGILCVPVSVNESRSRWTRFDTGCNDALHWVVPRAQDRASRRSVSIGFLTNPDETSLTNVVLGGAKLERVETVLHGRALFPGEAGLLGNGMLSRYMVTVDEPGRQVVLSAP